jgi:glycosyltransferase involved in cell wall biosynthesis
VKIALIAPCWITVPPQGYGGIELVVALLADGLVERDHEVTLFASGGSQTKAKLISYYETPPGTVKLATEPMAELPHVLHAYSYAREFDVIHDHTSPLGPSLGAQIERPPVVHTLHGPHYYPESREIYEVVGRRLHLVAISNFQRDSFPGLNYAGTVYNGIAVENYTFRSSKQDYLLFLGRMSEQKGAHIAVETARRLGRRLIMATKIAEPVEKQYFDQKVRPLLTDEVEILGELSLGEKVELYANAFCTLMPIQWPEPFGLVMTESMACGTPVVAFRNGSVPEIIEDGVTGFIADDFDGFVSAVERAAEIESATCRASVEAKFSTPVMVDGYEAVYRSVSGQPDIARSTSLGSI